MKKTKFKIQGIKCSNCSLLIEEKLKSKEGIVKVKVDQTSNKGVVIYDEQKVSEQDIYQTIESINDFHLEKIEEIISSPEIEHKEQDSGIKKAKFIIKGLKCDNCVLLIESRLKDKPGIVKVKVDQNSSKGVVIYDEQKINESDIYKTIEEMGGFKVEKIEDSIKNSEESTDYDNPAGLIGAKSPIESSGKRGFAIVATIVLLIFLLATFGPKGNQARQASEFVQNNNVQDQQQAQRPSGTQQPQATTLTKSDNPTLEAYVVARCPYGIQMQRAMADAVKNIPALAQYIKVRYIGSVSGNTITSMHGPAEAAENLRQICIREEQSDKYWNYVSCQMKSGDTAGCESSTGVDSSKLSACTSNPSRGAAYSQKDFDLNSKYQIRGSPTLILNSAQVSESAYGGRSSDGVKAMVCAAFNLQPSFCSIKLTAAQATASFSETY